MPRPLYPHSVDDIASAVDGPLGLVVGDLPDGTIWVLRRNRREPGYVLSHYPDSTRSSTLSTRRIGARGEAITAMARAIGLEDEVPAGGDGAGEA